MSSCCFLIILGLLAAAGAGAQTDFSGLWKLNSARSEVHPSVPADLFLRIEQTSASITMSPSEDASAHAAVYPLDGRTDKRPAGDSVRNTQTKWEGAALIASAIVSGPRNYTVMERWKRSNDGKTLTIKRTVVRGGGESEALLVYERAGSETQPPAAAPQAEPSRPTLFTRTRPESEESARVEDSATRPVPRNDAAPKPGLVWRSEASLRKEGSQPNASPKQPDYIVAAGTRVLLRLTNPVNTKHTAPGDRIYLETAVPVYVDGRLVIPAGSYVSGRVTESKRAGRVKGTSALSLEFDSLTLRNGVARDLRSRPGSVDTQGNLDRTEGRIEGESNKGGDAATVGKTTAVGTGVGAVAGRAAGNTGMGAGVGAAAGAAAGLAGILSSRGKDVILPAGTTMEMVVNRDLRYTHEEVSGRN